jgi:hypothetical protein
LATLVAAGCGDEAPARHASLPDAPGWVKAYCKTIPGRERLLCPTSLPAPFKATENVRALAPNKYGYVLEGHVGERHWTIAAERNSRSVLAAYGRSRRIGEVRVRGRRAQLRMASADCGTFSDHLTLEWTEGGDAYAVSVHRLKNDDPAAQRDLRAVAASMRPAPR